MLVVNFHELYGFRSGICLFYFFSSAGVRRRWKRNVCSFSSCKCVLLHQSFLLWRITEQAKFQVGCGESGGAESVTSKTQGEKYNTNCAILKTLFLGLRSTEYTHEGFWVDLSGIALSHTSSECNFLLLTTSKVFNQHFISMAWNCSGVVRGQLKLLGRAGGGRVELWTIPWPSGNW